MHLFKNTFFLACIDISVFSLNDYKLSNLNSQVRAVS